MKEHLEEVFACRELHMAISIGALRPQRKPTIRVLAHDGRVLGYVKVGWNEITRALVRKEAAFLGQLAAREAELVHFRVPRLIYEGRWHDLELLAVSDVGGNRWWHRARLEFPTAATHEMSALFGTRTAPLATSGYWAGVRRVLDIERGQGHPGSVLPEAVEQVEERFGLTPVQLGSAHGDWSPWNMACPGGRLVVWDWERASSDVPVGFDAVYFTFMVELLVRRVQPLTALRLAKARAEALSVSLNPAASAHLLLSLVILEVGLRVHEGVRAGVEVRSPLYAALEELLAALDLGPSARPHLPS